MKTNKSLWALMSVLVVVSLVLTACGPETNQLAAAGSGGEAPAAAAAVAGAALIERDLIVVCSDGRCAPNFWLQTADVEKYLYYRSVASQATKWTGIEALANREGFTIGRIFFVLHYNADATCGAGCGGMAALNANHADLPAEFAAWLRADGPVYKNIIQEANSLMDAVHGQTRIPTYGLLLDHSTGELSLAARYDEVGREILDPEVVSKWLIEGGPAPILDPLYEADGVRDILHSNMQRVRGGKYAPLLDEMAAEGQPFSNLVYTTSLRPIEATTEVLGGRTAPFVVTILDDQASAVAQMAYAMRHAPQDAKLWVIAHSRREVATLLINGLDKSDETGRFLTLSGWTGEGNAILTATDEVVNLPRVGKQFVLPISGGSGAVDVMVPPTQPEFVLALREAGVATNEAKVASMWPKISEFVGKNIRIISVAGDVAFVAYVVLSSYQIFGFGELMSVNTAYVAPNASIEVLDQIRVPMISSRDGSTTMQPAWWLSWGSATESEMRINDVWVRASTLMGRGETPCGGFEFQDPRLSVPMIVENVETITSSMYWCVEGGQVNDPSGATITFRNLDAGESVVTYAFNPSAVGGWEKTSGEWLYMGQFLDTTQFPGVVCWEGMEVEETTSRIIWQPHCMPKQ